MKKSDVVQYFGKKVDIAAALGITPPAISTWKETIPERRALLLHRMTKGKKRNGIVLKYRPEDYEVKHQDKQSKKLRKVK